MVNAALGQAEGSVSFIKFYKFKKAIFFFNSNFVIRICNPQYFILSLNAVIRKIFVYKNKWLIAKLKVMESIFDFLKTTMLF